MVQRKKISDPTFLKRMKDTVKYYDMLKEGDRVLVAVSGGPDSVCLLNALCCVRRKLGVELAVANLDHGLRGKESRAESLFVKHLADTMGLKVIQKKVVLKRRKHKGLSIEELARRERYKFFNTCANKEKCTVIATGHTIDDQAETVLMRIIRGTALQGFSGIPPVRYDKHLKIIRPLIRLEKADILQYLENNDLKYVIDSSNKSVEYFRNSVRLDIIPFLEKYNPRLKRSLSNMADTFREDLVFIKEAKKKALADSAGTGKKGKTVIKIKDIVLLPKALRKEVVKEMFERSGGNVKKLTHRHWMDIDYFIKAAESKKSLDLPRVVLVKTRDELVFTSSR